MKRMLSMSILGATLALTGCQDRADVKNLGKIDAQGHMASAATNGTITGTIEIADELKMKLLPTDVLFVFARPGESGPPLAAKRYGPGQFQFPLEYQLSSADMMAPQPGMSFSGEMKVFARVSHRGDAIGSPGDFEGFYAGGLVTPPVKDVNIKIGTERM